MSSRPAPIDAREELLPTRRSLLDRLRRRQPAFHHLPSGDGDSRETATVERLKETPL